MNRYENPGNRPDNPGERGREYGRQEFGERARMEREGRHDYDFENEPARSPEPRFENRSYDRGYESQGYGDQGPYGNAGDRGQDYGRVREQLPFGEFRGMRRYSGSEYGGGEYGGGQYGSGQYGGGYGQNRGEFGPGQYEREQFGPGRQYRGGQFGPGQHGGEYGGGPYRGSQYGGPRNDEDLYGYGQYSGGDLGRQYGAGIYGGQYGQSRQGSQTGWGQSGQYGQQYRQGPYAGKGPRSYKRSDQRVEEDVNERLTQNPDLDATNIDVRVQDCEVTLTGTVQDRASKRLAEDCAESISGVREIHNQLRVQPQSQHEGNRRNERLETTSATDQTRAEATGNR